MFRKISSVLKILREEVGKRKRKISSLRWFNKDYKILKAQLGGNKDFPLGKMWPIFEDKFSEGGTISGHYFHQDMFVAKKILQNNPEKHLDIGSRVDGFIAHVAIFRLIEICDIRPIQSKVENIKFIQADFMKIDPEFKNYTDSISSLHAIEHFGLGRYNDPIDAFGHIKGLDAIYHCLKPGGKFYFSVPIGPQRIEFNAHRVFSIHYLLKLFENKYIIKSFSFVDDSGDLHEDVQLNDKNILENFNCNYGCGIFEMDKIKNNELK